MPERIVCNQIKNHYGGQRLWHFALSPAAPTGQVLTADTVPIDGNCTTGAMTTAAKKLIHIK
jgi:hypothetical protein